MCHANQVAFLNSWGLGCHLHPLIGCAFHILHLDPFASFFLCLWCWHWPPEGTLCRSIPHSRYLPLSVFLVLAFGQSRPLSVALSLTLDLSLSVPLVLAFGHPRPLSVALSPTLNLSLSVPLMLAFGHPKPPFVALAQVWKVKALASSPRVVFRFPSILVVHCSPFQNRGCAPLRSSWFLLKETPIEIGLLLTLLFLLLLCVCVCAPGLWLCLAVACRSWEIPRDVFAKQQAQSVKFISAFVNLVAGFRFRGGDHMSLP